MFPELEVLDGYSKAGEEVITESDDDYDSQDFMGEEGEDEEDDSENAPGMNAKWYKEKLGDDAYDSEEGEEEVDEEYGDEEGDENDGGPVKRAKKDE